MLRVWMSQKLEQVLCWKKHLLLKDLPKPKIKNVSINDFIIFIIFFPNKFG